VQPATTLHIHKHTLQCQILFHPTHKSNIPFSISPSSIHAKPNPLHTFMHIFDKHLDGLCRVPTNQMAQRWKVLSWQVYGCSADEESARPYIT
jgi:hypothetical protein